MTDRRNSMELLQAQVEWVAQLGSASVDLIDQLLTPARLMPPRRNRFSWD